MDCPHPESDNSDWIPLGEALARFSLRERENARLGHHTLAQWARTGLLRTMAASAHGFFAGRVLNERDWPIPVEFWQRLREHEDFAWEIGNLELALQDSPGYDSRRHLNMPAPEAIGVKVNSEDFVELIKSLPPVQAPSSTPDPAKVVEERNKPGPKADADWDWAVYEVTAAVIAASYSNPLERGQKASIQTQLLSKMAERHKHMSEDSARNYANRVINALPDK